MSETPELLPIIVLRLVEPAPEGDDLRELAKRAGYRGLAALLAEHPQIEAARAIQTIGPKELLAAEQRARDSDYPPLHSLTSFWRLDCSAIPDAVDELIDELSKLPEIGLAYRQNKVVDAGPVMSPSQNPIFGAQHYLDPAKEGIGVLPAWNLVDGSGVGFADVERDWMLTHEDLAGLTAVSPGYVGSARHGAAVLGVVLGRHNTFGVIGIAPGIASAVLSTHVIGMNEYDVAGAVTTAALAMSAGDVLLIEVQLPPDMRPAELDNLAFTAIRLASGNGIIVVEAAGNGSLNLATFPMLDRTNVLFEDSGAILVGGGTSTVPHGRAGSTNYGARIDCYAWAENVATASSADRPDHGELDRNGMSAVAGTLDTQRYTKLFGGTSAAAAIVAGATVLVQAIYQLAVPPAWPAGQRLSPKLMRGLLKAFASSTEAVAGSQIGRMPNLGELVKVRGGLPDLYIRDDIGDTGAVPSAGAISVSPDVAVSPTSVTPAMAFAAGGTTVELGQKNFVYVRVSNRSPVQADNARVRVYWSDVATLVLPDSWTPLNPPAVPPLPGSEAPFDAVVTVPGNGFLVEAPEIPWEKDNLPPTKGHRCFVATVDHQLDPQPDTAVFTWAEFLDFVRNYNNVTWRNFNVVDDLPTPPRGEGGAGESGEFLVRGAPDAERVFDLEILQSCPGAVSVVWELPRRLFRQLDADFAEVREPKGCRLWAALWPRRYSRVSAVLQPRAELVLPGVSLEKSAQHQCRFRFAATEGMPEICTVAIRQLYDGLEVGRVTWELRAGRD